MCHLVCITFAHQVDAATRDNCDAAHSFCFDKTKTRSGSTMLKEQYSPQANL